MAGSGRRMRRPYRMTWALVLLAACGPVPIRQPWEALDRVAGPRLTSCVPADSGWKIGPGEGFEMWFWYLEDPAGLRLNLNLIHGRAWGRLGYEPTLLAHLRGPGGEELVAHRREPYRRFRAARDRLDLAIGGSRLREVPGGQALELDLDGITGSVRIRTLVTGIRPEGDGDRIGLGSGRGVTWRPPVAHGEFEAELRVGDGPVRSLSGAAYYDHLWMDVPAARAFRWHYWAKLWGDDTVVLIGDTVPGRRHRGQRYAYLGVYRAGRLVLATDRFRIVEGWAEGSGGPEELHLAIEDPAGRGSLEGRVRDNDDVPIYRLLGWTARWADFPIYDYRTRCRLELDRPEGTLTADLRGYHMVFPCGREPAGFRLPTGSGSRGNASASAPARTAARGGR